MNWNSYHLITFFPLFLRAKSSGFKVLTNCVSVFQVWNCILRRHVLLWCATNLSFNPLWNTTVTEIAFRLSLIIVLGLILGSEGFFWKIWTKSSVLVNIFAIKYFGYLFFATWKSSLWSIDSQSYFCQELNTEILIEKFSKTLVLAPA